jgi:hypothetical protein
MNKKEEEEDGRGKSSAYTACTGKKGYRECTYYPSASMLVLLVFPVSSSLIPAASPKLPQLNSLLRTREQLRFAMLLCMLLLSLLGSC